MVQILLLILAVMALYYLVTYGLMGIAGWGIASLIAFLVPIGFAVARAVMLRNPRNFATVVEARYDGEEIKWQLDETAVERYGWKLFGIFLGLGVAFFYAVYVNDRIIEDVHMSRDDRTLLLVWWWLLTIVGIVGGLILAVESRSNIMLSSARQMAATLDGTVSGQILRLRTVENQIQAISTRLAISSPTNFQLRIHQWIQEHKATLVRETRALDDELERLTVEAADLHNHLKCALEQYECIERDYVSASREIGRHQAHSLMPVLDDCHKQMLACPEEFLSHRGWADFSSELKAISEQLQDIRSLAPEAPNVEQPVIERDGEAWQEPQDEGEKMNEAVRILGVTKTATREEISRRFHGLSQAFAPDRFRRNGEGSGEMYRISEERYKQITWAYNVLTGKFETPQKRV